MWFILLTFAGMAFDQLPDDLLLVSTLLFVMISFAAQSDIVRKHLVSVNMITPGAAKRPRIGTVSITSVIFGLAVYFGLLLLLLPGIYLASRWWAAIAVMFSEETSAVEALTLSWEKSVSHVPAISLALVILFIPSILSGVIYFYSTDGVGAISLPTSLVYNALASVSYIAMWISGSVTYVLLGGGKSRVTNIFE